MDPTLVTATMFGILIVCILLGVPLAFALGSVGVIFTIALWGWDGLYVVGARTLATMSSEVLICVPLFILMGALLQHAGMADALYTMVHRWAGKLPGALAMGTVVICYFIGAMSGITGAAAVSLGLIAIPSMLKRNYDKKLAAGTVAGGSTLCLIVPPSITMVIFCAMSLLSIGQLFMAGVLPGVVIAGLFIAYLLVQGIRHPDRMPPLPEQERRAITLKDKISSTAVVFPTLLIIASVLGSIFTGMATPNEAAAVGVVATIAVSALYHRFTWKVIKGASVEALKSSAMIMWILVGAHIFSSVYHALGASRFIQSILVGWGLSRWYVLGLVLFIVLVMGMFIDSTPIIVLIVPLVFPIVVSLGFNATWFGLVFNIAIMIGYLSPPFGLVLFYIKSVCPPEVSMGDLYRSVIPFIVLELISIGIFIAFPNIVLWLPRLIIGRHIVG